MANLVITLAASLGLFIAVAFLKALLAAIGWWRANGKRVLKLACLFAAVAVAFWAALVVMAKTAWIVTSFFGFGTLGAVMTLILLFSMALIGRGALLWFFNRF